jgi:hypothetical protein
MREGVEIFCKGLRNTAAEGIAIVELIWRLQKKGGSVYFTEGHGTT